MGAEDFEQRGKGKSIEDAFIGAVENAAYWNGHSGYTGTMAEKTNYVELPRPRVAGSDDEIIGLLCSVSFHEFDEISDKNLVKLMDLSGWNKTEIARAAEAYNSKWGPAVGWKASDHDTEYQFCGMASS